MSYLFGGLTDFADKLDTFTLVLTLVCGLITLVVFVAMVYFSWRFHHSKKVEGEPIQSYNMEIAFTIFTFVVFMGIFYWSTSLYKDEVTPKKPDYEIFVYGKQWMWKFYHQGGFSEVNDLHLPLNKNVRLTMISQDIIHSFYIPGTRTKQDVLPQMYTFLNLKLLKEGEYSIYCAEYCGSFHARMKGMAKVIPDLDYQKLIQDPRITDTSPGKTLFKKHGCLSCHGDNVNTLSVRGDDNKLRNQILYPKGSEMPSYKGVLSEEEMRFLIQYIRSMEAP